LVMISLAYIRTQSCSARHCGGFGGWTSMARWRKKIALSCSISRYVLWLYWCGRCEGVPGGKVSGSSQGEKKL
jgi:hypothetical protein